MKRYVKASYTVEASLILPFLLLIIVATIQLAIYSHQEIKQLVKEKEEAIEIPIMESFWHMTAT